MNKYSHSSCVPLNINNQVESHGELKSPFKIFSRNQAHEYKNLKTALTSYKVIMNNISRKMMNPKKSYSILLFYVQFIQKNCDLLLSPK